MPVPGLTLMFFGSAGAVPATEAYQTLIRMARHADRLGFRAVWTPERHFHSFGGLFPNPAVLGAALAMRTERIQIRAGSVVAPLHDPLRIVEEWAVVDALSGGRVAVALGTGWHARDFVLAPDNYDKRVQVTADTLDVLRRMWRGESVKRRSHSGQQVEVHSYPRPVQAELPVWLTASSNIDTFRRAGGLGAGVLTHLLGQDLGQLAEKITAYREAWAEAGHLGTGTVSVMLHTYVADTDSAARRKVRAPLIGYLRSSLDLELQASRIGGRVSRGSAALSELSRNATEGMLAERFEHLFAHAGLLGSPSTCTATLERLADAGVDEVACLSDFGLPAEEVLRSLERLADATVTGRSR